MNKPGSGVCLHKPESQAAGNHRGITGIAIMLAVFLAVFPVTGASNASCCCTVYNISCCPVTTPVPVTASGTGDVDTYVRKNTITGDGYFEVESSLSGQGVNWKYIPDGEALDRLNQSANYRTRGPGTYFGLYSESAKGELVTGGERTKAGLGTTGGGEIFLNLTSIIGKNPVVGTDSLSGAQSQTRPTMLTTVVAQRDPNISQYAYCSPIHCQREN